MAVSLARVEFRTLPYCHNRGWEVDQADDSQDFDGGRIFGALELVLLDQLDSKGQVLTHCQLGCHFSFLLGLQCQTIQHACLFVG